jgi:hypothetical protein
MGNEVNIEPIIQKILWGKSLSRIKDGEENEHTFILRSLTIKEANYVQFIYDKEYDDAILNGILRQKDLEELYEEVGDWTSEHENKIQELEKQIKILKVKIKNYQFMTIKKKQAEKQLQKVQNELAELQRQKSNLFLVSAEARAEEIKRRNMVMLSTETLDEEKYWQTEADFLEERDHVLVYSLAKAYFDNNIFDTSTLRKIARNPSWRFRWSAAKTGADLFGRPISEWSEMQNLLIYWSQYYDGILESGADRPDDMIVNDDNACDAWVEEQSKKNAGASSNDKNIFGTKKATTKKNHAEHFIMVGQNDQEAVKNVQDMNAPSVRERLKGEYDKIKNSKRRISEWNLRVKERKC